MFHYCSIDAFKAIVESRSIWASSSRYLNDVSEVRASQHHLHRNKDLILNKFKDFASFNVMSRAFNRVADAVDLEFFIASFCKRPDKLSQWRGYADGGKGVSIGFSLEAFKRYSVNDVSYEPAVKQATSICSELCRDRRSFSEDEYRKHCTRKFIELIGLTKSPTFSEEEECRLLGFSHEFSSDQIKIRKAGNFLVPYAEISLGNFWPDSITEIWLGPLLTTNPQIRESVMYFLKHHGLADTEINESRVSFRQ